MGALAMNKERARVRPTLLSLFSDGFRTVFTVFDRFPVAGSKVSIIWNQQLGREPGEGICADRLKR